MAGVVNRALGWLLPERSLAAEVRETVTRELQASNRRAILVVLPILLIVHLGFVVLGFVSYAHVEGATPAETLWLTWLVRLHAAVVPFASLLVLAAVRGGGTSRRAWSWQGDAVTALYVLFGAAVSANAQRAHAALNAFTITSLGVVIVFRARPWAYVVSLAVGCVVLSLGVLRFQPSTSVAITNVATTITIGILALATFFLVHGSRVRELAARFAVEQLNADLGRRVEEQVHEIVARARDVEQLNLQLNEKVSLRSEELSRALARLSDARSNSLAPGTVLGDRVEIHACIGAGGMGVVYRGFDRLARMPVAVKLIQAQSAQELDALHRFLQEARTMASVRHVAIVRSLHVDVSADGRLFEVMELIEGSSLQARLQSERTLPWPSVARLGATLADALACAHAAGIVHRDVKPSNVMLTRAPPGLKLLDFGIAKLRDACSFANQTGHRLLGTPQFIAPEQIAAPGAVGDRADVYALGVLLYQCIAGAGPYEATTPAQWLIAHSHEDAIDLRTQPAACPSELAALIMSCLRKEPESRPTAADLAGALGAIADAAGVPAFDALERARGDAADAADRAQPVTVAGLPAQSTSSSSRLETMPAPSHVESPLRAKALR